MQNSKATLTIRIPPQVRKRSLSPEEKGNDANKKTKRNQIPTAANVSLPDLTQLQGRTSRSNINQPMEASTPVHLQTTKKKRQNRKAKRQAYEMQSQLRKEGNVVTSTPIFKKPYKRNRPHRLQTRSAQAELLRLTAKYERLAEIWAQNAPVFVIPEVSLPALRMRPKPCQEDKEQAASQMQAMRNWPSDPFSAIFQDRDGHRLAAVFASRLSSVQGESEDSVGDSESPLSELDNGSAMTVPYQRHSSPLSDLSERHSSPLSDLSDQKEEEETNVEDQDAELSLEVDDSDEEELAWEDDDLELTKVASDRLPMLYLTGPNGHPGRTMADLEHIESNIAGHDGFPLQDQLKLLAHTQLLHAILHPKAHSRDVRHQGHKSLIDLNFAKARADQTFGLQDKSSHIKHELYHHHAEINWDGLNTPTAPKAYERCGVTHLVHGWHPQGHRNKFVPSADLLRSADSMQAVRYYYNGTRNIALRLAALFKTAFPAYYSKYKDAFKAGVWEPADPGPFLGRAIVWKLPVLPHRDGLDAGPAAIFPVGNFSGGELYLPDLQLKLTYRPGDIIILMAGDLYHAVGDWEPEELDTEARKIGITTGRVSHVFFFPKASASMLEGKPKNWASSTMWGRQPNSDTKQ